MKQLSTILLLLIICLCSVSEVSAQRKSKKRSKRNTQIYPGYVITAQKKDTIYGEIQFINPVFNQNTIVFIKDGKKFEFSPSQGIVSEYGFEFKRYNKSTQSLEPLWFVYVRKLVPNSANNNGMEEIFMERQIDGEITLYNHYTLRTSRVNSHTYEHSYFVEKKGIDGFDLTLVSRENYRNKIREYLVLGNLEMEVNFGTNGYGYKYLSSIVSVQNAWLSGNPQYDIMLSAIKNDMDIQ